MVKKGGGRMELHTDCDTFQSITSDAAIAMFEYIQLSVGDADTKSDEVGRRITSVRPDCILSVFHASFRRTYHSLTEVPSFRWHPRVCFTKTGNQASGYKDIQIAELNNWHSGPGTQKALTLLAMRHVPRLYSSSILRGVSMDVIYMIARLLLK
jgi:hypothetical protein